MPARRRKHQKKDVEAALREAERHGFIVESPPKGYFKVKCPPPCADHMWQVHLTPSATNYAKRLLHRFQQCPEWKDEA